MRLLSDNQPLWLEWAQQSSHQAAFITPTHTYNWQQVSDLVELYATYLRERGLSSGDVLTIVGKNQPETVPVYLAAITLGVVCSFTMPQPVSKLEEKLETLYRSEEQAYLWLPDSNVADTVVFSRPNVSILSIPTLEEVSITELAPIANSTLTRAFYINALATIVFTSGSTGTPKAVAHTLRQHLSSADGLLEVFHFNQGDTWLLSLPMYHVSGLAILHRWLFAGGCLKIGSGNLDIDIQGCSHASLVATQLHRLLENHRALDLTHVLLGGSHIPAELTQQAQALGVETWLGYGMTEAASTVTAMHAGLDFDKETAGHLLKHRQLKIENERIFIGGETLAAGYYHQGELKPLADAKGWFDSKDIGAWSGEQLRIIGRADNQFISGGENIHCEEIERALNNISEVKQAFVIPVEDVEFGFRPVAIVECDELASKVWFDSRLDGVLERYKYPIEYHQLPDLELQGIKISRVGLAAWLKQERS